MPDHGAVTITPGTSAQPIDAGYHNGSGSVEGDADLVAGNIADGVEIFGVTGTGTMTVGPPAPVEKTGQTKCYDLSGTEISCTGTGQDGDHQAGVAWPNPRFTDNSDGTVTDNLTGLIWLKKANCGGSRNWSKALTFANALYDGWTGDGSGGDCDLSDNSSAGDWRLPHVKELQSLIDFGHYNPALPGGHPFFGVQAYVYWSSATSAHFPSRAWVVNLNYGSLSLYAKSDLIYVWPVRGGQ
jgi:hypothetical protein